MRAVHLMRHARRWGCFSVPTIALGLALSLPACQGSSRPSGSEPSVRVPCTGEGSICTWAGSGERAFTGDGALALDAALYWPLDIEFAPTPDERAYILDWQNHRVRRVARPEIAGGQGVIDTVIGTDEIGDGPGPGGGSELQAPGVPGTSVNLNHPTDIQFAPDGTLVLASWHNHKIRKYDVGQGALWVSCGRGPGFAGDGGPAETALMSMPKAIAFSPAGDLYIVDTRNFRVRRIAADTGAISTVVGVGTRGAEGDGGDPLAAQLSFQKGLDQPGGDGGDNPEPGGAIAVDAQGRLYIADTENQRIRRVDLALGTIETVAGNGTPGFSGDGGAATQAQLRFPRDVEIAPDGRLFIADSDNHRIRAVDLGSGIIETVAGSGAPAYGGDGGPALEAAIHRPWGIGFDAAGDLYIADTFNDRIRRVVRP